MKILVVDDDPYIVDALTVGFTFHWRDATVISASSAEAALQVFEEDEPDVVVLDVAMPGKDGFAALREIRLVSDVPVIMLTARGEEVDQVRGLELGADDYVVKPFSYLTLLARITAVLRRSSASLPAQQALPDFAAGDFAICFQDELVTVRGEPVKLTLVEYRILYRLVRNAGRVVAHQALLDYALGDDHFVVPGSLKVFISRLRAKIESEDGPRLIENERGLGYRFIRPKAPAHSTTPATTTAPNTERPDLVQS
jgi:two-component system, OmpR family, KDP operon response regulator KdpE